MSGDLLHWVLGLVMLAHAAAHLGAIGALWWVRSGRSRGTGGWTAARSWVAPTLAEATATGLATAFWLASFFGFALAGLAFLGIGLPVDAWPLLAIVSAVVSMSGIVLFLGSWPTFNTLVALAVDVGLIAAAIASWPSASLLPA